MSDLIVPEQKNEKEVSFSQPSPWGNPRQSHVFASSQLPAYLYQVFGVPDWLRGIKNVDCPEFPQGLGWETWFALSLWTDCLARKIIPVTKSCAERGHMTGLTGEVGGAEGRRPEGCRFEPCLLLTPLKCP